MFCMSLMKEENRKAFKANEVEYLKKFNLSPEQTEASSSVTTTACSSWWQHLFHRQARRDRRSFLPAYGSRDDRIDPGGIY
jgi:hypothetical protein